MTTLYRDFNSHTFHLQLTLSRIAAFFSRNQAAFLLLFLARA